MTTRADKIEQLADDEWVEVEHPTTHETYGMKMGTFREVYKAKGFEVTRMGDGTPILADTKEPDGPPDNPPLGVQGDEQTPPDEPVVPTGETAEGGE